MERAGFAAETTNDGVRAMERAGAAMCPALGALARQGAWAGLRPVTPDLLPIIGRDPEQAHLVYACGHSRNGVLLAPVTGDAVGDLLSARPVAWDLRAFRVERFALGELAREERGDEESRRFT
jgi:glycine oxidase